jgi:uncharacterized repeat protein (TIGR03806 family)
MKKYGRLQLIFLIALLMSLCNCHSSHRGVTINMQQPAFEQLSQYHFFEGKLKNTSPSSQLIPYDIVNRPYEAGMYTERFFYIPKDSFLTYHATNVLEFPVGSCVLKNIFLFKDERDTAKGRILLETQLLVHQTNGWEASCYQWNDAQTDAFLVTEGSITKIKIIDANNAKKELSHAIVKTSLCKSCHSWNGQLALIGPSVQNLNVDYRYQDGKSRNQLDKWASMGILKKLSCPAVAPLTVNWNDTLHVSLQDRAIAYLEINCGFCHSDHGMAASMGLNLTSVERAPQKLGIGKKMALESKTNIAMSEVLVPGATNQSILFYELCSKHPMDLVEALSPHQQDQKGIALIREWIMSMDTKKPLVFQEAP